MGWSRATGVLVRGRGSSTTPNVPRGGSPPFFELTNLALVTAFTSPPPLFLPAFAFIAPSPSPACVYAQFPPIFLISMDPRGGSQGRKEGRNGMESRESRFCGGAPSVWTPETVCPLRRRKQFRKRMGAGILLRGSLSRLMTYRMRTRCMRGCGKRLGKKM